MSDSSIALKPVIDEPSNPIPSSSAASISLGVTAKLFRCPSMSVNQRSRNSIRSSLIRSRTCLLASGSLVALGLLSTCATLSPPFKTRKPRALSGARGRVASERGSVYSSRGGQLLELRLAAVVGDRACVEPERGRDGGRPAGECRADAPDVADRAEHGAAARLADRVRLARQRDDRRPHARLGDLLVQPSVLDH